MSSTLSKKQSPTAPLRLQNLAVGSIKSGNGNSNWQKSTQGRVNFTQYNEESSPEPTDRHKKAALLTGHKFRETLPLITDCDNSSRKEYSVQAIKEEGINAASQSIEVETHPPTTFDDYRKNMQTGSLIMGPDFTKYNATERYSKMSVKVGTAHNTVSSIEPDGM